MKENFQNSMEQLGEEYEQVKGRVGQVEKALKTNQKNNKMYGETQFKKNDAFQSP